MGATLGAALAELFHDVDVAGARAGDDLALRAAVPGVPGRHPVTYVTLAKNIH